MLFHFLVPLAESFGPFNLFRYLTFRTGGAMVTAMLIAFCIGPVLIRRLGAMQGGGQPIREDGPDRHWLTKQGTPTMGGLLILIAGLGATIIWADPTNPYLWTVILSGLGFGLIGLFDDIRKVRRRQAGGMPSTVKFLLQIAVALPTALAIYWLAPDWLAGRLAVPFAKEFLPNLGLMWIALAVFVSVGTSNAVNLTDGLDGLAIVPIMIAAGAFGFIAWLIGNAFFAEYLQVHYVPGTGELAVLCGALIGSGLGFLWYNAHPARIFMGDTGSLATGGMLAAIALITRHEIVLAVIGGLFVVETVSVILQVLSFRLTGRRIFRMAPLHHHYEQKGWPEATVVVRFWIIAAICALAGLATLKLR